MKTTIRNFGRVNDSFYRGAQPRVEEYAQLAGMGVRTVIDLCDVDDKQSYARAAAEKAGLSYLWLPMSDRKYPAADTAPTFLDISRHTGTPVFVHCAGGRHRTGAMTAVYRLQVDKWSLKRAMREMESYFGWPVWVHWAGHTKIRDFVKDYWDDISRTYHVG